MMIQNNALRTAVIGLALIFACGTALARPTASVNGVTFLAGIMLGGNTLQSGIVGETDLRATGVAQASAPCRV
jgi:hypothetical protein